MTAHHPHSGAAHPGTGHDVDVLHDPDYRPTAGEVFKRLLLRAILPGLVVAAILWGIGWILEKPLGSFKQEDFINQWFADGRTDLMNEVTHIWSTSTDTWFAIGFGIFYSLLVWALTKRWWLGLAPVAAITLESSIFVPVTNSIGRERPTVPHLDPAPPTSSYPSGHTAAAFALYWTLAVLAQRIPWRPVRLVVTTILVIWPFLVAYARLYRGMHHASDVFFGFLLGLWCVWTVAHTIPGMLAGPRARAEHELRHGHHDVQDRRVVD